MNKNKKYNKKYNEKYKKWTISKIITLYENKKLVLLPHQRPIKRRKNSVETLINNVLNKLFPVPIFISDLKSDLEYAILTNNKEDIEFFSYYVNRGFLYSIEDGQHRIDTITLLKDHNFKSLEDKNTFLSSTASIIIFKYCSRKKLIDLFTKTNGGKQVKASEKIWGINNEFNNEIKNFILNFEDVYFTKTNTYVKKRNLFNNWVKILYVYYSFQNNKTPNPATNEESLRNFINSGLLLKNMPNLTYLSDLWYNMIMDYSNFNTFTTQSNLFFILAILKNKNYNITNKIVYDIMSKITNTRLASSKRYREILKYIESEEFTNGRTS